MGKLNAEFQSKQYGRGYDRGGSAGARNLKPRKMYFRWPGKPYKQVPLVASIERNVFHALDPIKMVRALHKIIHEESSVDEARKELISN